MRVIKGIGLVVIYIVYILALIAEWLVDISQKLFVVIRTGIEEAITGDIGLKKTIDKLRNK